MASELPVDLVERAASGDRRAQGEILEAHYGFVRNMLVRLVGRTNDLEDLQQVVLMRVVQKLGTFRGRSTLKTWIGGICVNEAKHYLRQRNVRAVVTSVADMEPAATTHQNPETREALTDALAALDALPVKQRVVFVLKAVLGHSIAEIATLTGSHRSTVRLRLYYARKRFFAAARQKGPSAARGG